MHRFSHVLQSGQGLVSRPSNGDTSESSDSRPAVKTYLAFTAGLDTYAVELETVSAITDSRHLTLVPDSPSDIAGWINAGGRSAPVLDLAQRLGVHRHNRPSPQTVLVLQWTWQGRGHTMGLLVDKTWQQFQVRTDAIIKPAAELRPAWSDTWTEGQVRVRRRRVTLLNLPGLLNDREWDELRKRLG